MNFPRKFLIWWMNNYCLCWCGNGNHLFPWRWSLNSNGFVEFNQGIYFFTLIHSVSLSEDEGNQKSCFFPSWTERIQSVLGGWEERMIIRYSRFNQFHPKYIQFSNCLKEKTFKNKGDVSNNQLSHFLPWLLWSLRFE